MDEKQPKSAVAITLAIVVGTGLMLLLCAAYVFGSERLTGADQRYERDEADPVGAAAEDGAERALVLAPLAGRDDVAHDGLRADHQPAGAEQHDADFRGLDDADNPRLVVGVGQLAGQGVDLVAAQLRYHMLGSYDRLVLALGVFWVVTRTYG